MKQRVLSITAEKSILSIDDKASSPLSSSSHRTVDVVVARTLRYKWAWAWAQLPADMFTHMGEWLTCLDLASAMKTCLGWRNAAIRVQRVWKHASILFVPRSMSSLGHFSNHSRLKCEQRMAMGMAACNEVKPTRMGWWRRCRARAAIQQRWDNLGLGLGSITADGDDIISLKNYSATQSSDILSPQQLGSTTFVVASHLVGSRLLTVSGFNHHVQLFDFEESRAVFDLKIPYPYTMCRMIRPDLFVLGECFYEACLSILQVFFSCFFLLFVIFVFIFTGKQNCSND